MASPQAAVGDELLAATTAEARRVQAHGARGCEAGYVFITERSWWLLVRSRVIPFRDLTRIRYEYRCLPTSVDIRGRVHDTIEFFRIVLELKSSDERVDVASFTGSGAAGGDPATLLLGDDLVDLSGVQESEATPRHGKVAASPVAWGRNRPVRNEMPDTSNIQIRECRPSEHAVVDALALQAWQVLREGYDPKHWEDMLEAIGSMSKLAATGCLLVATEGDTLCGAVAYMPPLRATRCSALVAQLRDPGARCAQSRGSRR